VQKVDRPQKNGVKKFTECSVNNECVEICTKALAMQWLTKILLLTGASFVVAERSKF
jgi:hypothetical protein